MEHEVAVKQLCEFYAIPPLHTSPNRGSTVIKERLEGAFGLPLDEVEKKLKFDQVKASYDTHMRRIGKELTHIVKQICR